MGSDGLELDARQRSTVELTVERMWEVDIGEAGIEERSRALEI